MSSTLLTSWSAYDDALQQILDLSPTTLLIFDRDLSALKLEQPQRANSLQRLLAARRATTRLAIVVQNTEFIERDSPRLMNLLATYFPAMTITAAPPQLSALSDSLLIADDKHALIRFHHQQARSRLIIDEDEECRPYCERFSAIVDEGGDPVSPNTLGL